MASVLSGISVIYAGLIFGPFVPGESGRAIAEGKKSVFGVFDVELSLGILW